MAGSSRAAMNLDQRATVGVGLSATALRHTIVSIHPPDDQEHCPCAGQRQWPADQFVALFHSWCVGFSTPIPAVPQLFSLQFVLSPGLL